jgi:putative FmdB family regulatory protein
VPTYQYACTECGHSFDIVQSFSDDALTVCPECSGRLRKVFNAVGVVFKGSGFYRTDSREKKASSSASTTGSAGSDSGAGSAPAKESGNGTGTSNGSANGAKATGSGASSTPKAESAKV